MSYSTPSYSIDNQAVSAPLFSDSAGHAGQQAVSSVFRVICPNPNKMGTCFLHKSGKLLTAAHVVSGCAPKDLFIFLPEGKKISIKEVIVNDDIDIALLTPVEKIEQKPMPISSKDVLSIGTQISTWGFPYGYNGAFPMLTVGFLSGRDSIKSESGKIVDRLVVNAAFNSGNSGGPVVDLETSSVIGIVSSKLAPMPSYIENALRVLKENKYGLQFTKNKADGTKEEITESQILEEILQYLRRQTQLVIGHAILLGDIRDFLKKNKIEQ